MVYFEKIIFWIGSILAIILTAIQIWRHIFDKPKFYLSINNLKVEDKTDNEFTLRYDLDILNRGKKGIVKIMFALFSKDSNSRYIREAQGWIEIDKDSTKNISKAIGIQHKYHPDLKNFPLNLIIGLRGMNQTYYEQNIRINEDGSYFFVVGRKTVN